MNQNEITTAAGKSIWVVRHGMRMDFAEPEWVSTAENPYDPPLHGTGEQQAAETAERLRREGIDHLFSSPFLRTLQTAGAIADLIRKVIRVEPGFTEWLSPGHFHKEPVVRSVADSRRRFPAIDAGYQKTGCARYPEDESAMDDRTANAVRTIARSYAGNLLIVSHGSPIQSIHKALTGNASADMPSMGSVTRFVFESGEWKLVLDADSSHLTNPDTSGLV